MQAKSMTARRFILSQWIGVYSDADLLVLLQQCFIARGYSWWQKSLRFDYIATLLQSIACDRQQYFPICSERKNKQGFTAQQI